jgi:hypothetical protein
MATLDDFIVAQSTLGSDFYPQLAGERKIFSFGVDKSRSVGSVARIPMHIRTGAQSLGNPTERKRFTQIEFHGTGTLKCRVYVDGVYICESSVTLSETPSKDRRLGIPIGTRGYTIDIEFVGDANVRAVEYTFKPMGETS